MKEGDMPSSLMFRRMKVRQVKNENEEWVEGQKEVSHIVLDSLLKVYQPPKVLNIGKEIDLVLRQLHCPQISPIQVQVLDAPITEVEIREAMFDIHKDKSPGPDGMIDEFFHEYWDTVGCSVVEAVGRFFSTGHILKEWNQALLVMIPKVANPELAAHFRPIGLCNTIYKCVSKCMVKILKVVLPVLISDYQHALIPGRYMEDNIILIHELMHVIN